MIMRSVATSFLLYLILSFQTFAFAKNDIKTGLQLLPEGNPNVDGASPYLTYEFDLSKERFYIFVPKNYTGSQPFGVLVYLDPSNGAIMPPGWGDILQERKLIFISPMNAGNEQAVARRAGLAVISAYKLMEMANIDASRIYVSGLSGGARIASYVSFIHPDLFTGVIAICGTGFPSKVDRVKATMKDYDYGYFTIDDKLAEEAKERVRFVLVTGKNDFRYGNILDLYNGGFLKYDYAVKLLDVPGMGHAICSPQTLGEGLDFLDMKRSK